MQISSSKSLRARSVLELQENPNAVLFYFILTELVGFSVCTSKPDLSKGLIYNSTNQQYHRYYLYEEKRKR